ncbi:PREDICTED: tenascin-X [Condylura cristata]|uniref:tenascin-X n=1 Tax=Condylura cristata TaxID=143302 RepID=UPI000643E0B6|nr:PREDICTED: tenascin-X [Condylura cristata]
MPAQGSLTSKLALLVLLGTVRAGPFSPRFNVTRPAPRPPPQPGGRAAEPGEGSPSSQLYEHTVEGGEKQVVFTHRINLPSSAGCGCPPGTEPPVPASEVQALRVRLEILEELVKGLKEQCNGGCCPAAAQAGTGEQVVPGQTDVRSLCSLHGKFDLSRCACSCEPGWGGPTCSDPTDAESLPSSPPSGSCPDDCNDQGRCVDGRCVCFPGYAGPSCGWPSCPADCHGRGRCVQGVCVCRAGFSGDDCSVRACPRGCRQRGRCENGRCVCNPGYSGEDCGVRSCPRGCSQKGRCEDGRCVCDPGYTGEDCGSRSCRWDCGDGGRCVDGRCVCWPGYAGEDCSTCDAGYAGDDCGVRSCPRGCLGRGRCLDGRCACDDGYEGEDCGVRRCPRDCHQRGVCQDGVCACWEGYGGADCGLRTCPANCHGRGRCEDGRCVCDPGYTGPACATRTCPSDCRGRGRCVQGVCLCYVGYSGEDCGQEEPPASACLGGCGPRELCRDGQCVCVEGFRGPDCAIQTCPGDCYGHGECREGSCVCQEGYAGEDCREQIPAIEGMRMHLLEETTVRTEWTRAPGPVDAYEIQFIPTTEGVSPPFTTRVPSSASAYDQRGLAPGQEYQVTVRALRGTSWGPPASKTITTMIDGPQDLRVVAVTPTTLDLSWLRPQAEVDRFVVSYVSAGNQRVRLEVPPEEDRTLLTDLMPGVEYVVTVTAERGPAVSYPSSIRANTGSSPLGLLGATDEPPPSGPSTTQGVKAPGVQQRPQELGELRVLGRDKTGHLLVVWTAQPNTFAHFRLSLQVPEGQEVHEELLPGDVRQALVPSPPPGASYELTLRGVPPTGEPSAPLFYQGIMDKDEEKPEKPRTPPRLGELTVTNVTSNSLLLHWTVPEGEFDSFVIQYKDRVGAQVVPVEGSMRSALITNLELGRKYKFILYGLTGKKKHGPRVAEAKIVPLNETSSVAVPRLGKLWVTDPTPDSLRLSWTVLEGQFDSFVVQYRDKDGRPHVEPVEGPERSVIISPLDPDHKYRFTLFGIANKKRHGPLTADGTTATRKPVDKIPSPTKPSIGASEHPREPRLGELAITDATPNSLHLSWTVPEGQFDHFLIQYKNGDGQPKVVRVPGHEDTVTISGLEPDHKYKMNLYGFHEGRRVGPISTIGVTAPDGIEPTEAISEEPVMGELTVTGTSPDSLSLSWIVPQGHFDSFSVQYKGGDGPQVVRVGGEEREVTVQGLEPGRKYKMHLYGLYRGRRVGPVSTVGTTAPLPTPPPTEPPLKPRLGELTVTDVTPDSVDLSWTVPEGEFDSFVVQYKDRAGSQPRGPQSPEILWEETPPEILAMFPVSPAPLPTATPTEPPLEPRLGELTVTDMTPDSVGLSWTVLEGEFDSFVVQYKDRAGQPQVVPVAWDQREVTIPSLEPDKKYKFLLFGIHDGKRRGPVSVEAKTAAREDARPGAPPRLGELWVTDPTPDSLRLLRMVPEGHFDSFAVQFKDRDWPRVVPVDGQERSVIITPLEADHKYRFLLYSLWGKKRHGPLKAEGATKKWTVDGAGTKPHLGEELQVTGVTSDSVRLLWTVPEGQFDSFVVQYKDRDGQPQVVPVEGSRREVSISGLDPNHRYQLLLYGLYQDKRVGPISATAVTAARDETKGSIWPPSPPAPEPHLGALTVEETTPHTVRLSWMVTDGEVDSFEVQYTDEAGQLQIVPVEGDRNDITLSGLESKHRYLVNLYGFHGQRRVGPAQVEFLTGEKDKPSEPPTMTPRPPIKPRLGELAVTDATPNSLHLSWTVPEGQFDHFLIQYKNGLSWTIPQGHFDSFSVQYKGRDGPQVVRVGGEEREVTVRGLEPGRKYKMHLYGLHGGQRTGPMSTVGTTARGMEEEITLAPTDPPATTPQSPVKPRLGELAVTDATPNSLHLSPDRIEPTEAISEEPVLGELTVTGATPDSLSLSWTVPEGHFDSFSVQYKGGDGPQVAHVGGEEREVTVRGLEPGRKYKVHLYGLHGGQRVGPVSTVGTTAPDRIEPTEAISEEPVLGELTVTGSSPDSLSLSWIVPQGHFDSFSVQYKGRDGPQVVRVSGEEREVTVRGLEPGHKYKMHLYGLHGGQRMGPMSTVGTTDTVTTQALPATTPESPVKPRLGELAVTDATPNSLHLSWTVPEGQPTEAISEEPVLGELTVTGTSPDSLSLSWTVPQGHFDSFSVQYKGRDGPQVVRVSGEEREVTVRGLEPGRKYKVHLYGLHEGRRVGPMSTVGTTEPPVIPRLGELAVEAVTSDSAHLSWTVAQGSFDSFLVQYKDAQGQLQAVPVGGDLREVTVSGLVPARKYKFLLFGLQDEKRHGPVSAEAKTFPDSKPSPRLGELTVTDVTLDSVGLSWTVLEGEFDSFVVQYKDRAGQTQVVPVAADQREVTIPGLEPNKKYKFLLYGLAGKKRLGPASAEGSTASLKKELGVLTVTDETPHSLRLSWTVVQGPFDSFVVQYEDSEGQLKTVPAASDQREVTVEGLAPGRTYNFLLYGLLRGQRLGPVSVLGVTAPEDTPASPDSATKTPTSPAGPRLGVLAVNDVAPDSLRLSWSVAQGPFDSFVVQYWDKDGQPQALLVGGDQDKVLVSGLEPSTSYKFFLYGLQDGKRLGPISAEGTTGPAPAGLTPGELGPHLSQLSVSDVTTSSMRLSWEAPPGAFDSFLLRFGVPLPSTLEPYSHPLLQRELKVPGTEHSAVLRDLSPGTLYSLMLYGLRGPHKADSIQGTARTLSPVLESPRDLNFSEVGETSAKVHWTPPLSRVDSFKVSYQLADGGEPQSMQVDGGAQTQKLEKLVPGTRYEVTVVSVRGFEESEPLTGFLTTVSDGPTNLHALNLTNSSVVLRWSPPHTAVDEYDVRVTAPKAPSVQGSAPGSAVDYPITGLEQKTNYTATVRGLRGPNFTSPASITFTTGLEPPGHLEAKKVTPRTALLTWTEPHDPPTGYLLSFSTPGEQPQEILLPGGVTSHELLGLFPSTPYNAWLRAMWGESFTPPVSTSFTTGGLQVPFPRDCGEEMQNGAGTSRTTTVFLNGNRERPLNVFCDMETDGGGWLVFQRRMDGQTDFWRDWEDYAHGFGNVSREFWLGNEALHSLTKAGDYSLRVDLRAGDEAVFAQYDSFRVDSAAEFYRLHVEGYHGTAGDSMSYHSGSVFSARDRDPNNLLISCAVSYRGAWWYKNCHYANLNGLYGSTVDHQGVSWYYWKGFEFSVPFTEMKLRPRNYQPPAQGG